MDIMGSFMKHITLKEMLEREVQGILNNKESNIYYWKDGDGNFHVITELDIFSDRFKTDNDDFSCFEWEIEDSNIYMNEEDY